MDEFEQEAAKQLGATSQATPAMDEFDHEAAKQLSAMPHQEAPRNQQFVVPPPPPTMPTGAQVPPPAIMPGSVVPQQQTDPPQQPQGQLFNPPQPNPPSHDDILKGQIAKTVTGLPFGIGPALGNIGAAYQEANTPGNTGSAWAAGAEGAGEGAIRAVSEPAAAVAGMMGQHLPNYPEMYHNQFKDQAARNPGAYNTGALGGNVAATMGAGGLAGMGAKKLISSVLMKAAPEITEALTQVVQQALGKVPSPIKGAAAGAGIGATQYAGNQNMNKQPVNPQEMGKSALGGAALGGAMGLGEAGLRKIGNILPKEEPAASPQAKPEGNAPESPQQENRQENPWHKFEQESKRKLPAVRQPETARSAPPPQEPDIVDAEEVRDVSSSQPTGHKRISQDRAPNEYFTESPYRGASQGQEHGPSYIPLRGKGNAETAPRPEQIQRAEEIRQAGQHVPSPAPPVKPEPVSAKKISNLKVDKKEPVQKKVSEIKPTEPKPVLKKEEPKVAEKPPLQGHVEKTEEVMQPEDFNPPVQEPLSKAKAIYDKIGKAPPPEEKPSEEPVDKAEQWHGGVVPRKDVEGIHGAEGIDWNNSGKQLVRVKKRPIFLNNGKIAYDEEGNPRWTQKKSWVSGRVEGDNFRVLRNHSEKRTENEARAEAGQPLDREIAAKDTKDLTPEEINRLKKQAPHVQAGESRDFQAEMNAKHRDIIENNDMSAAQKIAEDTGVKKLGDLKKKEPVVAYSDPFLIGVAYRLAKATGKNLPEAAKLISPDLPAVASRLAKMHNNLDRIQEGADAVGDNIHRKLIGNLALEAHHTRGLSMEGPFGQEARQAIRTESPDTIMDPDVHPGWTPEQREAVATKKAIRMDTKQTIKDTLAEHGDDIDPEYEKALNDYAGTQFGHRGAPRSDVEKVMDDVTGNLYNAFFRWNPAFHGLLATHPLQMGSAVTGVKNIATAYSKMLTSPRIRKMYGEMEGVTEDQASLARAERRDQEMAENPIQGFVNKARHPLFVKDIPTGKLNNAVIHYAGMLKEAEKVYGKGRGVEAINKLADGTLPEEEALGLHIAGIESLIDATGGGSFGMNRSMLQDMPIMKHFAQLSGYKHIVARYHSKIAQQLIKAYKTGDRAAMRDALGKLTTLTGATVLLGGHAIIPKELEEPLAATIGPKNLYTIEHGLDMLNAPAKIGINLTDHMQYSLLNYGENAALSSMGQLGRDLVHLGKQDPNRTPFEKYTDMLGHVLMMTKLSAPAGVGVSTLLKGKKGIFDAARGQKKLNIYSKDWMSPSMYPESKNNMAINVGDVLRTMLEPGVESRQANKEQQVKFDKYFKKYAPGERRPDMEADYPTPGIVKVTK